MKDAVLTVDIGTTSLKVGIFSTDGEVVSVSVAKCKNISKKLVAEDWMGSLRDALSRLYYLGYKICGICVSGNGPTVVSQTGKTLRWDETVPPLNFSGDASKSLFVSRLVHFKNTFNDDFSDSEFIFSGPEYFIYQLTGSVITILPEERFQIAYWTQEALKEADFPAEKLPPYVEIGHDCGFLKESTAYYLGLPAGIPVFAGGPDFVMALIGTNTLNVGKLCDRCGSSEGYNCCIDRQIFSKELRTLPSVIPGLWNISYLIPNSSRLSKEDRIETTKVAVEKIKSVLIENDITQPSSMSVSGGQSKDKWLLKKKAEVSGLKIVICNKCNDAELLGDLCAFLKGSGAYKTLQEAACDVIRENVIY